MNSLLNHIIILFAGVLSFSVQLMEAKKIQPLFGGSSSIWIASLMFFQISLLLSYFITYLVSKNKNLALYSIFSLIMFTFGIVGKFLDIPIIEGFPTLSVLLQLLPSGLFFIGLLQISPLIQFFSKEENPYKYYASSNLGSFLGLLSYPLLIENLSMITQQRLWLSGSILVLIIGSLIIFNYSKKKFELQSPTLDFSSKENGLVILLAAAGTFLIGAYSFTITEDISGFPLLWTIPLSSYLLSFALIFGPAAVRNKIEGLLQHRVLVLSAILLIHALSFHKSMLSNQIALYSIEMTFVFCIVIYELYKLSKKQHTSTFYLLIAIGGAIGGVLNNLVPFVFKSGWELWISLSLILTWMVYGVFSEKRADFYKFYLALLIIPIVSFFMHKEKEKYTLAVERNFYGRLRVETLEALKDNRFTGKVIYHGTTVHGVQFDYDPDHPSSYYEEKSGVGLAFKKINQEKSSIKAALIGLGAGSLATYGRENDIFDFYEIDENVVDLAKREFTFLSRSKAKINFIIGDGRKKLQESNEKYDIIVVDAFSSDAIPIHLMTKEAFSLYLDKLEYGGVIAIHISNNHLDLSRVLEGNFNSMGKSVHYVVNEGQLTSIWGIIGSGWYKNQTPQGKPVIWTDDKNNALDVYKRN